ncbi:MAG TPA: DAK2 domain-containing protein [Candidatus Rubrimentiphilum sp.]|nr:DAK2 domain-containing protein [Candidatus Rubrimentiphilum sp.]
MAVTTLDGRTYARFLAAGAFFVRKYRQVLNDLNVFPVPDGDTGTNMFLTLRQAAIDAAKVRNAPLHAVAEAAAQGSLMGARGNSGVIMSQMLRGFAHHVRHDTGIDAVVLAAAMREAVHAARQALVRPVEGTILSVAGAAAGAAYTLSAEDPDLNRLLEGVVRAANDALDRTPEQLPILKEAGVVDAGGAGLVYFLEGALRFVPGSKDHATNFPRRPESGAVFTPHQIVGERKFCTEFILEESRCSLAELREVLEPLGDSLIVAGAAKTIKVHVHTADPQAVTEVAAARGTVTRTKVDNMEQQHNVLVVEAAPPYSIVAVVPGDGFARIVRELGVEVPVVAQKNPSVRDLLLAVNSAISATIYLFTNDKNVVLAAQEAAKLSSRVVHIVPTPDVISGIAGLFALRSGNGRPADVAEILAAAAHSRSAQVFFAGKDATLGGTTVARGKPAAASGGNLYGGTSLADAAEHALEAMGARDGGLITVYYGGAQKERDAQRLAQELSASFPAADVEYYFGGQRDLEFWISRDE